MSKLSFSLLEIFGIDIKMGRTKHGESKIKTKLYRVWISMKTRCLNPKFKFYKYYGGRGIIICPEWTNDYTKFRDWALNNGYQEGLFIDRENPDGNYEPSNCRFLTIEGSNRNKTNTINMKLESCIIQEIIHKRNWLKHIISVVGILPH